MGSSAALRLSPGGAVAVGLFAGTLSTFGFGWLSGVLEQKLNLGDTCGVHVSVGGLVCLLRWCEL
jgi:ammonium transporter Rh